MESKIPIGVTFFIILYTVSLADNQPHFLSNDDLSETFGEVIYTQILFRHGDRVPDKSHIYPTDPNQSFDWKEGSLQLTKAGKLHAYKLGKWVRQYYSELIKPYRYDAIMMNSSDLDRTLMSAETFLAGMYPPSNKEMWNNENLRWQPIPVHSAPKNVDNILSFSTRPCKRYDQEKDALNKAPTVISFYKEHQHIIEYVSAQSGVPMLADDIYNALAEFENVYDTIFIEAEHNLTIPSWAQDILPQMKSIADFHYSMLAPTVEMQRLKGGPLLKSIIDDIKKKVDGNLENRTFHIYSGQAKGVATLLQTLEIFNDLKPPYMAAVIIELRKKEDLYFVSVIYRNSSLVPPYLLKVPRCGGYVCTLEEFIYVTASKIPDNWDYECEVDFFVKLFYNFNVIYLGLGVGAIALIGVLIKVIPLMTYDAEHSPQTYGVEIRTLTYGGEIRLQTSGAERRMVRRTEQQPPRN